MGKAILESFINQTFRRCEIAGVLISGIRSESKRQLAPAIAPGPAIKVVLPAVAPAFDALLERVQLAARLQAFHPVLERSMGGGFAGEEKMKPVQEHLPTERCRPGRTEYWRLCAGRAVGRRHRGGVR